MLKNIIKIVIVIFLFSCKSENIENDPILNQDFLLQVESFQQTEEEPPNDETQERQIYRDSRGCIYITLCSLFLSAALAWLIINLITNNKDD